MNIASGYDVANSYSTEKLAGEHAKTAQFQNSGKKFLELLDEHISSISPDNKSIPKANESDLRYSNLDNILLQADSQEAQANEEKDEEGKKKSEELVDYLIKALENKGKEEIETNANMPRKVMREEYDKICGRLLSD